MTKSRLTFFLASCALAIPLLVGSLLTAAATDRPEGGEDSLYKYLSVFTEALGLIQHAYVEEADSDALIAGAFDGLADALDPFSLYVPASAAGRYQEVRRVGASRSGLFLVRQRGVDYIVAVQPGSPGDAAGIRAGDVVAEIVGRSTRGMPLWEVEEILAGEPGTAVSIKVLRLGESLEASFVLGSFAPEPLSLERPPGVEADAAIELLRIPGFEEGTPARVEALLGEAAERGVRRLAVDLRGVAGGSPEAAYGVAGLFVDGPLGSLEQRGGVPVDSWGGAGQEGEAANDRSPRFDRLVVLVDRSTLGPAEILATVLRQGAGAELVGGRTFGYAGRQAERELSSGARLFLTDAFYTGPDGEPLDEPLAPDVRVSQALPGADGAEDGADEDETDPVLERALEQLQAPVEAEAPLEEVAA